MKQKISIVKGLLRDPLRTVKGIKPKIALRFLRLFSYPAFTSKLDKPDKKKAHPQRGWA